MSKTKANGYIADESRQSLRETFGWQVNNTSSSVGSLNGASVVTKLTGVNHLNKLPTPNMSDKAGSKAGANVSASVNTDNKQGQVQDVKSGFQTAVKEDMNKPLQAAMEQGAENLKFDSKAANSSFGADAQSTMTGVLATTAAAKTGGMLVAKAVSAMDASTQVNDAIAHAGKLSPAQEAKLADQMRTLLSPTVDPLTGKETAPPAIASNLNTDALKDMPDAELVQTLKQAMLPAENQPEWAIILGVEAELAADQAHHKKDENVNQAVLADAEKAGLSKADVAVEDADLEGSINLTCGALVDEGGFNGMRCDGAPDHENIATLLEKKNASDPSTPDLSREAEAQRLANLNVGMSTSQV